MNFLGVTEMTIERTWNVFAGEVSSGHAPDTPSLALPLRASLFHVTDDFCHYDLKPLKDSCTRH